MKPGRELDALIAERVMGYQTYKTKNPFNLNDESIHTMSITKVDSGVSEVEETQNYSTDIAAAWTVVEKLRESYASVDICNQYAGLRGQPVIAKLWIDAFSKIAVTGDSAPHAICLAALKAVGVKI